MAQVLKDREYGVSCEDSYEFGRVDIAIKPSHFDVLVEANNTRVVVEVKTGRSLSFAQLFRYLLQYQDAVLVVWRIPMRQVFTSKGEKLYALLYLYGCLR